MAQIVNVVLDKSYRPTVSHIPYLEQSPEAELACRLPRSRTWSPGDDHCVDVMMKLNKTGLSNH